MESSPSLRLEPTSSIQPRNPVAADLKVLIRQVSTLPPQYAFHMDEGKGRALEIDWLGILPPPRVYGRNPRFDAVPHVGLYMSFKHHRNPLNFFGLKRVYFWIDTANDLRISSREPTRSLPVSKRVFDIATELLTSDVPHLWHWAQTEKMIERATRAGNEVADRYRHLATSRTSKEKTFYRDNLARYLTMRLLGPEIRNHHKSDRPINKDRAGTAKSIESGFRGIRLEDLVEEAHCLIGRVAVTQEEPTELLHVKSERIHPDHFVVPIDRSAMPAVPRPTPQISGSLLD